MIILQFIVHKTKIGKAMRAVSHDMDAARLMGINVNNTISATFAIGSASSRCSRRYFWYVLYKN